MGLLSVVATPIGNLEDITARAVRTLREVDLVVAEDTRVTRRLLSHLGLDTPAIPFHEFSDPRGLIGIISRLKQGGHVAVVTDSGTPGISDPGAFLVSEILRSLPGHQGRDRARTFRPDRRPGRLRLPRRTVHLLRFPAGQEGTWAFFSDLARRPEALVIYEAPHRIAATLTARPSARTARPLSDAS